MAVMKAMGMESDQEVVQMLGRDPQYATLLLPSIEVSNPQYANFLILKLDRFLNYLIVNLLVSLLKKIRNY